MSLRSLRPGERTRDKDISKMIKFLGIADLFSALILTGLSFGLEIPVQLVVIAGIYLISKGAFFGLKDFVFHLDFLSLMDILAGVFILATFFLDLPQLLLLILAFLVGAKGLMSLV